MNSINPFTEVIKSIRETGNRTIQLAETNIVSLRDSVADCGDEVIAFAKKQCSNFSDVFNAIASIGVTISFVAAPVPTIIALAILWLMENSISQRNKSVDLQTKTKKEKRSFLRATKLLIKYGSIPQTSLVTTSELHMEINAASGEVTGQFLRGPHKGKSLDQLTPENIDAYLATCEDKDTAELLKAFSSYSQVR